MRVSELCGMRIKDIDLVEQVGIITGKGNKTRWTVFGDRATSAIKEYLDARGERWTKDTHPVFMRHDKRSGKRVLPILPRTCENIVSYIAKEAGVGGTITPHSFRHYFATELLDDTGNLALVQDALGHTSPNTTRIYAKITDVRLIEGLKNYQRDNSL
jgi:site-specific recombinase XerD